MTSLRRQTILVGVLLVMLAGAALWNTSWMFEQRRRARAAADDLAACRVLALQIQTMRGAHKVASEHDMEYQALGELISSASKQARLVGTPIKGVYHQDPVRVADTAYLSRQTVLTLRGVTLGQLTRFLYHLTLNSGLGVHSLNLRTPHSGAASSTWDADATLTYLIYSPAAARPNR